MALHRLVDVERVHAGRIEAGQPHVTHDHQLERIVVVLHALGQRAALLLGRMVLRQHRTIAAGRRHHHLDHALAQIVIVPFRLQLHDLGIQFGSNAPRHAHHHALARKHFLARLEMRHDVAGDILDALFAADHRFHLGPLGLGFLRFGQFVLIQLFVQLGDQLLAFVAQAHLRQTALVIDAHRRAIFHRLRDVVDVHVVAEHRRGVHIGLFNRCAGKAQIGRIRQRIAQVFGEAVHHLLADHFAAGILVVHRLRAEAVLRAVRLVGDHHDVFPGGQLLVHIALVRLKFLDGGEDHAARSHFEQVLQLLAVLGLHRLLPQQLLGSGEGVEQLVVQIVAVGNHQDRRVIQRQHDLAGVEHHRQRLARALRVPHHPGLLVAPGLLRHAGQSVAGRGLLCLQLGHARRTQGGSHRRIHRVILVIRRQLLHRADRDHPGLAVFLPGFFKDDEVAQQVQQRRLVQHAVDQHLQLAHQMRSLRLAIRALPAHEARIARRERTRLGFQTVGNHRECVGREQAGDSLLVGFQLLIRRLDGGVFIGGVFQFDHHQRNAVHEQHQIRPLVLVPPAVRMADHRELVGDDKLVVRRIGKVDQPHPLAALVPILVGGYRHALGQQAMECLVIRQQFGRMNALHFLQACLQKGGRQLGIDALERRFQPPGQQHLVVAAALRPVAVRCNIRRVDVVVAQALEQLDGKIFDGGFGEPARHRL